MADFVFRISPYIISGSYTSSRIGQFVREWGDRFMLIADPVLEDFGTVEKIEASLKERGINYFKFDEIPEITDTELIAQVLKLARDACVHGVISVGGTRTSSLARAVAALFNEQRYIYDFIDSEAEAAAPIPYITVPTTSSNSFLFTDSIPIVDARTGQIRILKTHKNLCRLAIYDPNLPVSLTDKQLTLMIFHTLCIAGEAYLSQKANFFSDTIAGKSIELLGFALGDVPLTTSSTTSKQQFAMDGGCMAALAAGCSSAGIASLLAQAISARHKLSPSLIVSILLPHLIEDAASYKKERLIHIANILNIAPETSSADAAVSLLCETVRNKMAQTDLPSRLADLSLTMEQLATCIGDLGKTDTIQGFYRSISEDDLFDLVKRAF